MKIKINSDTFIQLLLFIGATHTCYSQNDHQESLEALTDLIEERIEFMTEEQIDAQADYNNLFQTLEYYYHHPIELNHSEADKLKATGLLSDLQIHLILKHIEEHGELLAFEELQSVKGLDYRTLLMIRPFFTVKGSGKIPIPKLSTLLEEGGSQLLMRSSRVLEKQRGFRPTVNNNHYLGDPYHLYLRYRFQYYNRLSLGFTAEKDPGEEFFKGSQKNGFDFYSFHGFIQDLKRIKQLAIGDFQAQFGQGLTFWSGLAFGSGLGIASLKRAARKLSPYTSAQENQFLRGAGVTIDLNSIKITSFLSDRSIDANLDGNSNKLRSIYENGLHRTKTELQKRSNVRELIVGQHIEFSTDKTILGISLVGRRLNKEVVPRRELSRKFNGIEQEQYNLGINYDHYFSNLLFFGETAMSKKGGLASINGILWTPYKNVSLGILHRNYNRSYKEIQSNALGRNNRNSNEIGTMVSTELRIRPFISLFASIDLYHLPWLSYRAKGGVNGSESILQLNFKPKRSLQMYLRIRERKLDRNSGRKELTLARLEEERSRSVRLHLSYQIQNNLRLQSRIEWKEYEFEDQDEKGILLYQDIQYDLGFIPMKITLRYALFETEGYSSRIYAYENDLLYSFSIPPYYGNGSRFYILLKVRIKKGIDLWLRIDQTAYLDRDLIGSSTNEIKGSKRSQLKSQLRFTF